jgi:DNA-binding FadR family transcriptional regulator
MSHPSLPLPRRRSLAETVVNVLTEKIQSSTYRIGQRLPTEPELMAELGVSRTVVREAMSRLQASGLVETRHGVGTFVLDPPQSFSLDTGTVITIRDAIAMLEMRISLETEAAALAAMRRKDEHLIEMEKAITRFRQEVEKGHDGTDADFQFHVQIALATDNRYFIKVFRNLGKASIPRTRVDTTKFSAEPGSAYLYRTNQEHTRILDAIRRKDPEIARASMRMHLSDSRERLRKASEAEAAAE